MIIEERDYRIRAGFLAEFLAKYQELGFPVQRQHLGEPIGYFVSEIGELNHVVSMWKFDDLGHRSELRALMLADTRWPAYLDAIKGLIDVQNIRILHPTAFSPIR